MKIGRLFLGVVGSTLIATSAIAADLPHAPTVVAPPPPASMAAPSFDWSGLYFGAHAARAAAPFEIGAQVGYNFIPGRIVLGIELGAGFVPAGPAFSMYLKGRAGYMLGQRALLYGYAAIDRFFVIVTPIIWEVGGGAEFAVGSRISLFAEAGAIGAFGGGCCGIAIRGGVNFHPGN